MRYSNTAINWRYSAPAPLHQIFDNLVQTEVMCANIKPKFVLYVLIQFPETISTSVKQNSDIASELQVTENDHKRATVELEEAHIAMAMATATMFQALLSALMREKAISLQTIDDRILGVIEKIYDVPPELNIAKVYRMEAAAGMAMATKIRSDLLSD